MPIAPRLNQFINENTMLCQLIHHSKTSNFADAVESANVDRRYAAKAIPMIDVNGPAVAVVPLSASVDLATINQSFSRSFQVLSDNHARKLFKDCDTGVYPAFAMAYGLPVIVDESLFDHDFIYSRSGSVSALLKVSGKTFRQVMRGAIKGQISFEEEAESVQSQEVPLDPGELSRIGLSGAAEKLAKLYKLPPLPETAVKILHITSDDNASLADLSMVIERDPSLAAQIMKYARSALFNYPGEIRGVSQAINVVLGFDRVSQLAIGLAASKAFNIPQQGDLGLQAFWKHSLYCAVLCQALAHMTDPDLEVDAHEAYLAGMLHNFGVLLIGHLFPPEFRMLNKLRESEPEASMRHIEEQVFGMGGAQEFITMGHGTIGAILLKMWGLPDSSIKSAGMHQNFNYVGENESYVNLVQLSNALLSRYGIGDEPISENISGHLSKLGLELESVEAIFEAMMEQCSSLEGMIQSIAA